MKSSELMIGDWVYITSVCGCECDPLKQKIRGIEYISFKGDDYCDWVNVDCDDEVSLSDIEPIPITTEILKKNGFTKVKNEKHTYHKHLIDGYIYVYLIYIHYHNHEGDKLNIKIRYVHELQHALRLFGLDDLANNFKV